MVKYDTNDQRQEYLKKKIKRLGTFFRNNELSVIVERVTHSMLWEYISRASSGVTRGWLDRASPFHRQSLSGYREKKKLIITIIYTISDLFFQKSWGTTRLPVIFWLRHYTLLKV